MLSSGPYNPKNHEEKIYRLWEKGEFFAPAENVNKKTFTIMMPPPNVTGTLHLGHALTLTLEDIMIRYHRLRGERTLWLPGTDHAAIATQSKVEKNLYEKEGKTRDDLGRIEFLKRVENFARASHDTIVKQTKKMGASCDWNREAYTLDEKRTRAVYTAFKKMYDDGLIYRADRVVNWDPKGQTVISDDEVVYKERDAILYTFYYSKNCPIPIATTRPETKVGDTAIAVHPKDKRYKRFIGQEYEFEFCGEKVCLKVIVDETVDPEFGTGAVGVTPAHSAIDWEIAKRHNLPLKQVIDEEARLLVTAEKLKGKTIIEARKIIVEWLKNNDLLLREESVKQNVATAERTGGIIEPLPKKQWFINVDAKIKMQKSKLKTIKKCQEVSLKELMREVVLSDEIKIIPEHFEKIYFHWIDNLRDWCISRQIWFGHRLPVYYRKQEKSKIKNQKSKIKEEIYVGLKPSKGDDWQQDPDTLDTWFSSGLWTFSTLGWPEETDDLKTFHPTDVLETGYDILFFWVARMILMTTYLLGEIPFHYVYLHGLVRDKEGKKMNKSRGNMVDPLAVIDSYGTDALRMALVFGVGQGSDIALDEQKILAQKKFANKIWNAARFTFVHLRQGYGGQAFNFLPKSGNLTKEDKNILNMLDNTIKNVTKNLDNFMFHEAAQGIYQFFWHEFCDVYLESVKPRLKAEDGEDKKTAQAVLYYVFLTSLKLLHPFMPFITEVIYQELPHKPKEALIVEEWP